MTLAGAFLDAWRAADEPVDGAGHLHREALDGQPGGGDSGSRGASPGPGRPRTDWTQAAESAWMPTSRPASGLPVNGAPQVTHAVPCRSDDVAARRVTSHRDGDGIAVVVHPGGERRLGRVALEGSLVGVVHRRVRHGDGEAREAVRHLHVPPGPCARKDRRTPHSSSSSSPDRP